MEGFDHVGGLGGAEGPGGDQESGVVVDHVQNLDVAAVGEGPAGGVALPTFIGQLGLESPPGAPWAASAAGG